MSRFHNLEFDEPNPVEREQVRPRASDEASCLADAQVAFEAGRFAEALRAYARVLEFNPANAEAWAGQVRMLLELGEHHEAKLWADKAVEVCAANGEVLAAKAVSLARSGDHAAALAFSDAAVEASGQSVYVWLARADVLLTRKEPAAEYCVEKALGLSSFHWFALWLASRIHAFHHQFARALQLVQRALETGADRAVVWLQLGECRWALGMAAASQTAFEQARQLDPGCLPPERLAELRQAGWGGRVRGWWRRLRGA
jgi:tetratricopeptide (TPR) repeat protein